MAELILSDSPRSRVIRSLKQWIADGSLAAGEPLPSERELSDQLSVSRDTVRRAIEVLENSGVLRADGRTRLVAGTEPVSEPSGWMENAVAVVAPEGTLIPAHHHPGWGDYILLGVIGAVRAAGKHAVTLHPDLLDEAEIGKLLQGRPFGMIFPEFFLQAKVYQAKDVIRQFAAAGVPVVAYGDSPELQQFDRVASEHEQGAFELTQWLIAQGRRRILPLWFGPRADYWIIARRAGYERAMREAGLPALDTAWMAPLPELEPTSDNFEIMSHYIAGYLPAHLGGAKPVDAIMAITDGHVPYIAAACQQFGKVPNRDVFLVGYDNYAADMPELALNREIVGPLATVDKRNFEMGQEMVRLLMQRVAGELPDEPQRRLVAPKLIANEPMGSKEDAVWTNQHRLGVPAELKNGACFE